MRRAFARPRARCPLCVTDLFPAESLWLYGSLGGLLADASPAARRAPRRGSSAAIHFSEGRSSPRRVGICSAREDVVDLEFQPLEQRCRQGRPAMEGLRELEPALRLPLDGDQLDPRGVIASFCAVLYRMVSGVASPPVVAQPRVANARFRQPRTAVALVTCPCPVLVPACLPPFFDLAFLYWARRRRRLAPRSAEPLPRASLAGWVHVSATSVGMRVGLRSESCRDPSASSAGIRRFRKWRTLCRLGSRGSAGGSHACCALSPRSGRCPSGL